MGPHRPRVDLEPARLRAPGLWQVSRGRLLKLRDPSLQAPRTGRAAAAKAGMCTPRTELLRTEPPRGGLQSAVRACEAGLPQ